MQNSFCIFFYILSFCDYAAAYKILLFAPGHSASQILFNHRFGDLIASHGHNVTVFVFHYNTEAEMAPPKKANVILFKALPDQAQFREVDERFQKGVYDPDFSWLSYMFSYADYVQNVFVKGCENLLRDQVTLEHLRAQKFDLAISHMYDYCPMGVIHALGIPTYVWMSAGTLLDTMAWTLGSPNPPSFVPGTYSAYSDRMTFSQRFKNFLGVMFYHQMHYFLMVKPQINLFQKFYGSDFPAVNRLAAMSPLVFINTDEMLEFPRPILHKIIFIGGAHVSSPEPLNSFWQKLADQSEDGFFVVSFGAVAKASSMPTTWKDAFLKAFAKYPKITFVWKFEDTNFLHSKNVVPTQWMPLRDLLRHPKCRGLITHCGYNTFLEAANFGAPMVMVPLFNDQMGNRLRAERLGLGVGVDRKALTKPNKLAAAIGEILTNQTYKINARQLAKKLASRPVKPEKLVIGWIEYLAEFQNLTNLQTASTDLTLIEYFSLDVIATILLLVLLLFTLQFLLLRACIRKIVEIQSSKRHEKKN